jgi:A/G-specific adenine glycosylase
MDDLVDLPGVGPYVASAVISLHIGNRAVIVDSNVVRVLSRITGAKYNAETRRQKWLLDLADYLTPKYPREYNYALLDLGIQVCSPRIPACDRCPLVEMCRTAVQFEAKNHEPTMTGNG